jgi:PIN domain nuclease of toxin-antitoxin system
MRLLLDTHLLLWTAEGSSRLPSSAVRFIDDPDNELFFSPISLWEIAIKLRRGRDDFQVDPRLLRQRLLNNRYDELAVTSDHAVAVADLPPLHRDPFDRLLIAQCIVEEVTLLTADRVIARYPGPIERI